MVKPTDSHNVAQVKILRDEGLTFQVISEILGLRNRQAAFSAYSRYLRNSSYEPRKPPGRSSKLTDREKRQLVSIARGQPFLSISKVKNIYNSFSPRTTIGRYLVRKFLKKYNLRRRSAAKTLQLARIQRQNRVDWCRRRFSWSVEQWQSVIFSDEVRFCLKSDGLSKFGDPSTEGSTPDTR